MMHTVALRVVSLLSLLFMTFHLTHDVIHQAEGAVTYPIPVVVFALWLYATLILSERIWGHVIMLFGGLFATGMMIIHSHGLVVGKSGGFFFVWTLFALTTTGLVTMILAARGLLEAIHARRGARPASASSMRAD